MLNSERLQLKKKWEGHSTRKCDSVFRVSQAEESNEKGIGERDRTTFATKLVNVPCRGGVEKKGACVRESNSE